MIPKVVEAVSGYKTYIAMVAAIVVAFLGAAFGPVDMPGAVADIPKIEWPEFWNTAWLAISGMFLRSGVSKSAPK